MTHGSLFSGIGGFDLAAEWMGWENMFHCEINEFGRLVLKYYWPNAKSYSDIKKTDFTVWRGLIDVLSGGFPCQPYSNAGKRKGKDDDRHLWPEMLRAIREIQPSYVVGENVRGLINWNKGVVFDEVQADLEAEGYEVLPFLLPACGIGAPHRRDRIWFVAYNNNRDRKKNGFQARREIDVYQVKGDGSVADTGCVIGDGWQANKHEQCFNNRQDVGGEEKTNKPERLHQEDNASYANSIERCEGRLLKERGKASTGYVSTCDTRYDWGGWQNFPTRPPVCTGNDGFPGKLADIAVPSKKGIRILKGKQAYGRWRKQSIEALGNAIVPQVAYQIFQVINKLNKTS